VSDNLEFTNNAQAEMRTMFAKVEEMFEQTVRAVQFSDKTAVSRVMRYEGEINTMHGMYLNEHTQRLCNRKCSPMSALVFVDYINNLEKMADHLTNVAQASSGGFTFEEMSDM
jgi:phosphate:Na+ symporter